MASSSARRAQSAYEAARYDAVTQSLKEQIHSATFRYMVDDLGLAEGLAKARAEQEIAGEIGQALCQELAEMGIDTAGKRVLDLGAGLGGVASELARRGAHVVGLEPGAGWCRIAGERLAGYAGSGAITAIGEAMPFQSESMDLIVSLQVMEHVHSPKQVIDEAFRVLKPGGFFYFSYENYFGFWEPHYRVPWLPLLPKSLGAAYLKLRGRNPQFLRESVTYTTYLGVRRLLKNAGFACMRQAKARRLLEASGPASAKWRILKKLAAINENAALGLIEAFDDSKRFMRTAVYECMRKPAA